MQIKSFVIGLFFFLPTFQKTYTAHEDKSTPNFEKLLTFLHTHSKKLEPIAIPSRENNQILLPQENNLDGSIDLKTLQELFAPFKKTLKSLKKKQEDTKHHPAEKDLIAPFFVLLQDFKKSYENHLEEEAPKITLFYESELYNALKNTITFFYVEGKNKIQKTLFNATKEATKIQKYNNIFEHLNITPVIFFKETRKREENENLRIFFSDKKNYSFTKKKNHIVLRKKNNEQITFKTEWETASLEGELKAACFCEETENGLLLLKKTNNTFFVQPFAWIKDKALLTGTAEPISYKGSSEKLICSKDLTVLAIQEHSKVSIYKKIHGSWGKLRTFSQPRSPEDIEFKIQDSYLLIHHKKTNLQCVLPIADDHLSLANKKILFSSTKNEKYFLIWQKNSCKIFENVEKKIKKITEFPKENVSSVYIEEIEEDLLRVKMITNEQFLNVFLLYYNELGELEIEEEEQINLGGRIQKSYFPTPETYLAIYEDNTALYWYPHFNEKETQYRQIPMFFNPKKQHFLCLNANHFIFNTKHHIQLFQPATLSLIPFILLGITAPSNHAITFPIGEEKNINEEHSVETYIPEINKELQSIGSREEIIVQHDFIKNIKSLNLKSAL